MNMRNLIALVAIYIIHVYILENQYEGAAWMFGDKYVLIPTYLV